MLGPAFVREYHTLVYGESVQLSGTCGAARLIDRRSELDILQRAVADRVAIRLAAPRRFGKTSLLDPLFAEWLRRR